MSLGSHLHRHVSIRVTYAYLCCRPLPSVRGSGRATTALKSRGGSGVAVALPRLRSPRRARGRDRRRSPIVSSTQPTAADSRPRLSASRLPTDESRTAGDAALELLLLAVAEACPAMMSDSATVERVVRVVRTGGCRRTRERSLLAAWLGMLVQEPDVDASRVPEATGAPIRRHRRRDRHRLDGVGDQPSPSR